MSYSTSEGDFKPHLWRKLMGSGEDGVRKVLAMWKVDIVIHMLGNFFLSDT